jgi:hypothetical protein
VASVPDKVAIMPRRILRLRANQLATLPESALMMALSGSRGDSSHSTRCGLIGSASESERSSTTCHHSSTLRSVSSRQERSSLRFSSGSSARRESALSPTRLTSIG